MNYYYTILIVALVILLLWNRLQIEKFWLQTEPIPFQKPSNTDPKKNQKLPSTSLNIPIAQTWTSASTNWVNPNQIVSVDDCYQLLTPEQIKNIENSIVENFTDDSSIRLPAGSQQVSPTYLMPDNTQSTPFLRKDKSIVLEPIQGSVSTNSVLTPADWTRINNTLNKELNNVVPLHVANIPGRPGPTGLRGTTGAPGRMGPIGAPGSPGEIGPAGPVGAPGPIGLDGPAGPKGDIGPIGAPGPQGEKGIQGQKGDPGIQGAPGPAGPQGIKGDQGLIGPVGLPGRNMTLTPEQAGQVSAITQGDPGIQGPQGAPGPVGPAGPAGSKGDKGDIGATGPQGEIGPAGPAGESGISSFINTIGIIFQGLLNSEDKLQQPTSSNQSQIVNDAIDRRGLVLRGNKLGPNGQSNVYIDDNAHVSNSMFVGNNLQVKNRIGMTSNANTYGSYMSMDDNSVAFRGGIISNGSFVDNFPADYVGIQARDGNFHNGIRVNDDSLYVDISKGERNQYGMNMDDGTGNFVFTGLRAYGANHADKGSVAISSQGASGKIQMSVQGKNALQVKPSGTMYVGDWDTTNDDGVYDGSLNVKQVQKNKNALNVMNTQGTPNIHFMGANASLGNLLFDSDGLQVKTQNDKMMNFDAQGRLGLGGKPNATLDIMGDNPSMRMGRDSGNNVQFMMTNNNAFVMRDGNETKGLTIKGNKIGIMNDNPMASLDVDGTMAIRNGGLLVDKNGFTVKDETKNQKVAEFSGENGNFGLQLPDNIKPSTLLSLGGKSGSKINLHENGTNNYPGIGSSGDNVYMHLKNDAGSFGVYDTVERKNNLMTVSGDGRFGVRSADPRGDFCIEDTCINKKDLYEFILNNKRFIAADSGKGFLKLESNQSYRLMTVPIMNQTWNPFGSGGSSWFMWIKKPASFSNSVLMRRQAENQMGIGVSSSGYLYGFIGMKTVGDFDNGITQNVANFKQPRKTINELLNSTENLVQLGVVFVRLDNSVLVKMYVNGVLEWQYTTAFDAAWKLTPGELYYGSATNPANTSYEVGMATLFDLPFTDADMNQMYWLQRNNLLFKA